MNRQWIKRITIAAIGILGFNLFLKHSVEASEKPGPVIERSSNDGANAISAAPLQRSQLPTDWIFWSDEARGFGARFPGQPDRVGMSTTSEAGYAYIFVKKERERGGATYTIMVTPLPIKLTPAFHTKYLEARNRQYVQMAIDPASAYSSWDRFGGDRKRLNYKFKYAQDGMTLTAQGFWIIDRGRSIKVGVAYTNDLPKDQLTQTLAFPETFFLTKVN